MFSRLNCSDLFMHIVAILMPAIEVPPLSISQHISEEQKISHTKVKRSGRLFL